MRFLFLGFLGLIFSTVPSLASSLTPVDCWFHPSRDGHADCYRLEVLENRADPKSKKLLLPVAILSFPNSHHYDDPIVYLPGGPGDGGWLDADRIDFWWDFMSTYSWAAERDIILYDPRGVGMTQPRMDCPELEAISTKLLELGRDYAEANRLKREASRVCYQRLAREGFDPAQYTSAINAQDLHDLFQALDKRSWNVYGLSYGTRFALTYMRDFPKDIRSVILDSVLPPEVNFFEDTAWFVNRAMETLAEGCARSDDCKKYGDLRVLYKKLIPKLNARPKIIATPNPRGGPDVKVSFTGDAFIDFIFNNLYNTEDIKTLPSRIAALAQGKESAFKEAAEDLVRDAARRPDFGDAMSNSIECIEEAPFNDPEKTIGNFASYPLLQGLAATMDIKQDCDAWLHAKMDPRETAPIQSTLPVLLLTGAYDPVTPPQYARLTASRLDHAYLFEFPGNGHDVLSNETCANDVAELFINNPTKPPIANCLGKLKDPAFK